MSLVTYVLLWSIFAQIGLTFFVLMKMSKVRVEAIKDRTVTIAQIALNADAWPDHVRKVQNNYINQFEMPVLFYLACAIALILPVQSWIFVILAWIFVFSRIAHMIIHTGANNVLSRRNAFIIGVLCVMGQWVCIAYTATMGFMAAY